VAPSKLAPRSCRLAARTPASGGAAVLAGHRTQLRPPCDCALRRRPPPVYSRLAGSVLCASCDGGRERSGASIVTRQADESAWGVWGVLGGGLPLEMPKKSNQVHLGPFLRVGPGPPSRSAPGGSSKMISR
jgi:hypothetical protein